VPEYLDPLDGAGWRRTILDYAEPDSRARAAQLARLRHWRPPSWDDHFAAVEGLLARVVARAAAPQVAPPAEVPAIAARSGHRAADPVSGP
jgi:hypothetical protein